MSLPADRRWIGVAVTVLLLAWLTLAGAAGAEPPQRLAGRFAAAVDAGDVESVEALLAADPAVVTWVPALPRAPNTSIMALIDLGRARQLYAERAGLADYLSYHRALDATTELLGCEAEAPGRRNQERLYGLWVDCRFASTNELLAAVTESQGVLRGSARFGLRDGEVRAVLFQTEPAAGSEPVWEFMRWVRHRHPKEFDDWLIGPRSGPVISGESGRALLRLAEEYAKVSQPSEGA